MAHRHGPTSRCLAIIPARGGSKRIPRKNLQSFEGVPMLVHAIRLARLTGRFDEVLVSTDDDEIARLALRHGASVPFLRSAATANDHAPTFDVVHEVLDRLEDAGQRWDIGVCIYPTAVLARPEDVREAIDQIVSGDVTTVMPVARFDYPIWRALRLGPDNSVVFAFPEHAGARSQDLPPAFHDAGQWYAFDVPHLRRHRRFMDAGTRAVVLSSIDVQDIDTVDDLEMAALKFRRRRLGSAVPTARERPWVLVRVDATADSGSGHVMRCLSLAASFSARGHDVVFVSGCCPPSLRHVIEARGFASVLLDFEEASGAMSVAADAAAVLRWIGGQSSLPAWVVVDHYGLDATWERAIRCLGVRIVVIDDLANRSHACDVLVDQNMIVENHARYPALVSEGTRLLLGGKYALLRPEFAQTEARREQLLAAGLARDVVVFLGATDAQKLTMPLVSHLRTCVEPERIVVLVGALNEDRPAVEAWCQAEGIRCRASVEDVAAMLETCRVLVAACGMTAVEAQAIGIPCLLIPLSPIQRTVALWFAAQKRAVVLEPTECATPASVAAAWYETLDLSPSSAEERPISVRGAAHVVDLLLEPRP